MRLAAALLSIAVFALWLESPAHAQPQVGWQAAFGPGAHHAAGIATILDENMIQIDNFTYDGGGIVVYFYLGANESSFANGLSIGSDLFGTAFHGMQQPLVIDLPGEQTIDGWNSISVWCVAAGVSFASGTLAPVNSVMGDYNRNGAVDAADYTVWRDNLGTDFDLNGNGNEEGGSANVVDQADYGTWKANFGAPNGIGAGSGTAPEPTAFLLLAVGSVSIRAIRRR